MENKEVKVKALDIVKDYVFVLIEGYGQEIVAVYNQVTNDVREINKHWSEIGNGECTYEFSDYDIEVLEVFFIHMIEI